MTYGIPILNELGVAGMTCVGCMCSSGPWVHQTLSTMGDPYCSLVESIHR